MGEKLGKSHDDEVAEDGIFPYPTPPPNYSPPLETTPPGWGDDMTIYRTTAQQRGWTSEQFALWAHENTGKDPKDIELPDTPPEIPSKIDS